MAVKGYGYLYEVDSSPKVNQENPAQIQWLGYERGGRPHERDGDDVIQSVVNVQGNGMGARFDEMRIVLCGWGV